MNVQPDITAAAGNLSQWARYAVDSARESIAKAQSKEHRDAAKHRGWNLWKLLFWGNVPQLCKALAEPPFKADPWRLEQDLEALRVECLPQPSQVRPELVCGGGVEGRLVAIEEKLQLLAAYVAGLSENGTSTNQHLGRNSRRVGPKPPTSQTARGGITVRVRP